MLLNLEVRRKEAIEAGDLDAVQKIDRDIERLEAALEGRPQKRSGASSSSSKSMARDSKKKPGCLTIGCGGLIALAFLGVLAEAFDDSPSPTSPSSDGIPAGANVPPSRPPGRWEVARSQSAMDDSKAVQLVLDADNPTQGSLGLPHRSQLTIACQENETKVYVTWGDFVNNESVPVTYRIDDQASRTERWNVSTDYEATGRWNGTGINLIRQLAGSESFVIEVTPYGSSTQQARFTTLGLDVHLSELAEACGWSYP